MHFSGLSLQYILHNNIAVNKGEREFCIERGDTGQEKQWIDTMDDSGVVVLIQALVYAKIANKWVIKSYIHSDFASEM